MDAPLIHLLRKTTAELEAIDGELKTLRLPRDEDQARRVDDVRRQARALVVKAVVVLELIDEQIEQVAALEGCLAEIDRRSLAMEASQRFWLN